MMQLGEQKKTIGRCVVVFYLKNSGRIRTGFSEVSISTFNRKTIVCIFLFNCINY